LVVLVLSYTSLSGNQQVLRKGPFAVDSLSVAAESRARRHLRNFIGVVLVRAFYPNRFAIVQHAWSLPNCLDSGGLKAAVAGYEGKAEVEGRCGDDTVGHVGNNVARNIPERAGYPAVHGGDEQS